MQVQGCVLIVFSKGKNYHSLNTFWTIQYGSLSSTSSLRVLLISFRVTLHVHKINVKKEGEKKTEQSLPKKNNVMLNHSVFHVYRKDCGEFCFGVLGNIVYTGLKYS